MAADDIEIRRANDRFTTVADGIVTRHLLSFGQHYDPARTAIGPIAAYNDESLEAGAGYDPHRHRGHEIVSWVVSGRLEHRDSEDHNQVVGTASAQALVAGRGVEHSETNAASEPTRFVQVWLNHDDTVDPQYAVVDVPADAIDERFGLVARRPMSGLDDAPLALQSEGVALFVARLQPGDAATLPHAPFAHLYAVRGRVLVDGSHDLGDGDSALLTRPQAVGCKAIEPTEILAWTLERTGRL